MKWLAVGALLLTACGFDSTPATSAGDDTDDPPDTGTTPDSGDDILNLRATDEALGTGDLTIAAGAAITLDTSNTPTLGVALPAGVQLGVATADDGSGELAVLRVRTLNVASPLDVVGARPLAIVADTVNLSAALDVTAHRGGPPAPGHNVLTSSRGGAIEIYGKQLIAISAALTAGTDNEAGAIVLQGGTIDYRSGTLAADDDGGRNFGPGHGDRGRIYLRYKQALMTGTATPAPDAQQYQ